ncbi:hypothetical protein Maes01_01487 [Microbulbifer aestuariivivens]|uniref:DUF1853 family protein n=1 Tax=Microbulbifer aestuariivivens TaxID=1908308 RepID=A0ABP9WNZ8_9GAMM
MTDYSAAIEADHWANLLWAVSAAPIVRDCALPLLSAGRQAALEEFFARQETRGHLHSALQTFLAQHPSPRLGVYFENLWAFAFEQHPDYQLLARNLPLRVPGRTLGELDFVVRHRPSGRTEHWEIAVKFYLQMGEQQWVGPGLRDRLDIKLARMRDHQLPIALGPAASAELARHGWQLSRQWALMPGRLFRPLGETQPLPAGINPAVSHYWWATPATFLRHWQTPSRDDSQDDSQKNAQEDSQNHAQKRDKDRLQTHSRSPFADGNGHSDGDSKRDNERATPQTLQQWRWVRLPKTAWLADDGYGVTGGVDADRLIADFLRQTNPHPWCVAARFQNREVSRGFIVPEDWPHRALAALREEP